MAAPVFGVERGVPGEHGAGAIAHQRKGRAGEVEVRRIGLEFVEDRVEQLRVERVAGLQPGAPDAVLGEGGDDLLQILAGPGQYGVGAVVGRHRHPRIRSGGLFDPPGVGEHSHHPAALGQFAEQPAPLRHQPGTVGEGEHPGHARCRVLPDAVAQHDVGLDTPRLPQPGQTHLDGEQRRLRERSVPQSFSGLATGLAVGGEQHLHQGGGQQVLDRRGGFVYGFGEHRLGLVQLARHAGILAALAGEQPRRRRAVGVFTANDSGAQPIRHQVGQSDAGIGRRLHHQCRAVLEVGAPGAGRAAHVGDVGLRVRGHPCLVARSQRLEGFG